MGRTSFLIKGVRRLISKYVFVKTYKIQTNMPMKSILLFLIAGTLLISCKSQQKTEIVNEDENIEEITSEELFSGKVIDKKKNKLPYVAIKLVINNTSCKRAYTNEDGEYQFLINPSKIKDNSYFEVVYKGFVKKEIPYADVVKNSTIVLSTKGEVVTRTDYRIYYEAVRNCEGEE